MFEIGDRVKTKEYGSGVVIGNPSGSAVYPIEVEFVEFNVTFTKDGRQFEDDDIVLIKTLTMFEIGDRVKTKERGEGAVINITNHPLYPIVVEFPRGGRPFTIAFTKDGRQFSSAKIALTKIKKEIGSMFKCSEGTPSDSLKIEMRKLKPCQMARTIQGELVMRTASRDKFEVMSLSDPAMDGCWTLNPRVKVIPLKAGESVTLTATGN